MNGSGCLVSRPRNFERIAVLLSMWLTCLPSASCGLVVGDLPEPVDEPNAGGTTTASGGTGGNDSGGSDGVGGTGGVNTGGQGGTGASATGGAGGDGSAGTNACDPCDCDRDGVQSPTCGGDDCDDNDPLTKPTQTDYFPTQRMSGGFDYDCDNNSEREFPDPINCGALAIAACNSTVQGFLDPIPPCGEEGKWGSCKAMGLTCGADEIDGRPVECH